MLVKIQFKLSEKIFSYYSNFNSLWLPFMFNPSGIHVKIVQNAKVWHIKAYYDVIRGFCCSPVMEDNIPNNIGLKSCQGIIQIHSEVIVLQ